MLAVRGRRGSYFFVIDAFIASIIIVGALAVLYSGWALTPHTQPSYYAADDFFTYLSSTPVGAYDAPQVRNWTATGLINNSQVPLIDQLALFAATNHTNESRILADLAIAAVPPGIGIDTLLNGTSLANRSTETKDTAAAFFSSKRILIVRINASTIAPPMVLEVQTWQ